MNRSFQLSCESTVDLPYSYVNGRDISVLFYSYIIDGKEYTDDMQRDPEALPRFYQFIREGKLPSTSQINDYAYEAYFDALLQKGDVLHIAFGTGMTPSVNNAYTARERLREKYPDRKLLIVDSLCSSSGYGLMVDYAADMRDEGRSMEEIESWCNANARSIHHQFFSTDMTMFHRSGRVSGATAAIASVLNICPIMRLDDKGSIIAYDKVRGKKNAIKRTVDTMEAHARGGSDYDGKCFICNSSCRDIAEELKTAVEERFPKLKDKIMITEIGTIIASHSGWGTVAVFFLGDERTPYGKQ